MSSHHVQIDLSLDLGVDRRVVRCRIHEAASEPTHAVVEIAAAGDVDFEAVRAAEATLEIDAGNGAPRRFQLVVGAVRFKGIQGGTLRYEVHLHAHAWLLGHTQSTRKFRNQSARDIVSKVLGDHGIAFAWRTERATPARNYCVQYAESDLDFVSRLLAFEGIHFTFDPDGVMVLADRSSAAPPVDGPSSHFELLDAADAMTKGELGITELTRGARVAPGKATVGDFNWKTPSATLRASSAADRDVELETYDYPAGYRDAATGAEIARMRLEGHRVAADYVEGAADTPAIASGRAFSFGSDGGDMFAGEYFVVGVEHEAEHPGFHDGAPSGSSTGSYGCRFRAIPREAAYRPPQRAPRPVVAGSHTATVRGPAGAEIHTDKFGRFRAQFHWDREARGTDEDSRWVRMLQESATSMALARVGWEVGVAYIDGDPDRPVGLARHINGAMVPAYAQPSNKNLMTMKTPSSPATGGFSEIRLDDSAEKMLFYTRAEKDRSADIGHDRTEVVGHDERRLIGNDLDESVGRDQKVTVGNDSTETIDGDRHLAVDKNRVKTVAGSETVEVGGQIAVRTNNDETEKVGSIRITIAGGLQMPDILGRAKRAVSGLIPNPKSVAQGALSGAMSGAQSGAMSGFESGGIGGAAAGALGGAQSGALGSLTSLIPNPSGIASQITGGLSDGVSLEKIADQVLTGSITRTAEKKMSRTVGGAFIAVGIGNIAASAGKVHVETIGGLKLTASAEGVSEVVDGELAVTVGGVIMRKSGADMLVSSKDQIATVGAALGLSSTTELYVTAPEIEVEGLADLDLAAGSATLDLARGGLKFTGDVLVKGETSVAFFANTHNLLEA